MIPAPAISDHALLRWMERVHGVDVQGWRQLMQADLRDALDAYEAREDPSVDLGSFIISPTGEKVITVLAAGQMPSPQFARSICLARAP